MDLHAGDTIVIPAGHVHACNPHDGAWNYQFLQMDQNWARSQIDSVEQGRAVETWFSGIRVFRSPRLHEAFTRITKMVAADPQDAERVGAHLRKALEECSNVKPVWAEPEPATFLSATRLGSVLERLRDDERNPSLDELAQLAGMTRYQLIRSVKSATGLTPLAWRQKQKIIRARRMLAEGHDLAGTPTASASPIRAISIGSSGPTWPPPQAATAAESPAAVGRSLSYKTRFPRAGTVMGTGVMGTGDRGPRRHSRVTSRVSWH